MKSLVATQTNLTPLNRKAPKYLLATAAAVLALVGNCYAVEDRSVTLAWNANPEPNVAGYRLQYGTTPGVYSNSIDAGTTTTATASGLNQGTSYYFTVVAYDSAGVVSPRSSEVSYTVPGTPNTAPGADSFSIAVAEDGQAAATLSGTDPEGDILSYTVVSAPTKGTLSGTAPNLTYRPSANLNGNDSFTYRVSDGALNSAVATVSVTISPANDAPVATAFSVTTNEDASAAVLLAGTDVDGDSLTYSVVTAPTKGTLAGTPPNLTYQPAANLNGSDSFTFRVNDGTVNSANASVTINITAVNDTPVATPRSATTNEDTAVPVSLAGTDVEGSSLTYTIVSQPSKGALSGTLPNVTYTPALNANGADSFTFRVSDGSAQSAAATVDLTVTPVNDAPVANAASVSAQKNTAAAVNLTGSDVEGASLTYEIVSQPSKGVLSGVAPNLTYTPNTDVTGSDSFTFRVNDGSANSANATISISISAPNTAPVATPMTVTTSEDTNVAVVLAGTDADGNSLTFSVLTNPAKGTFSGTAPNLTYRPNANANGSDSFTFRVNDGTTNSSAATVNISITAVNDAPVAAGRTVTTAKNTAVGIVLSGTDVENSPLTYSVLTSPTKGSLSGIAPNLTYTPNTNATGSDSFTYRVNDGTINSATATVSITINNTNQAPQAASKSVAVLKGKTAAIELSASDAEGSPLTYRVVSAPTNGVLTGAPPSLSFKPESGFVGDTSFAYVANDGTLDSATAWVSIKVKASNAKPVAVAMSMTANWNTGTAVVLSGTDADSDPLTFSVAKQPVNGTLSGTPPNLVYQPTTGFRGKDSFTYVANDGTVGSGAVSVSITVINPNNRAPSSSAWSVSTPMKTAAPVALRATDADGDSLVYRIVSKPTNGKLTGKMPNLVFKPAAKFVGVTSFTYIASDGFLDSAPITVTINVTQPVEVASRGIAREKATAGAEALPQMSLAMDPARPGIIRLLITGAPGESYLLEHSQDLTQWSSEQEIMIGEDGVLSLEVVAPAGAGRGFYRLNAP